ncbi:MAG: phosphoribosylamine--glycine ligase [Aeromonas sp.]
MKVLIIGNGGREHALAWKVKQSPLVTRVFVAPGNAGTQLESGIENVAIAATDIAALQAFAQEEGIGLTIVGPEAPLVAGVVDSFTAAGLTIFGPTAAAAQLEGSKAFAKAFLTRHQIPTAAYQTFTDLTAALAYLEQQSMPIVIKADGLAAGKGVIVAMTRKEANLAVRDMLAGNAFGAAGSRVVIEEFLSGEEASFIVMVDGEDVLPMATSQDHKRAFDGDMGPNTGGMGAYSPAPVVCAAVHDKIMQQVILPTVRGMQADGLRYRGFLYAGLMIDAHGNPKVIEFNCRFGDPETQPIMLRMQSDLVAHCLAGCEGRLATEQVQYDPRAAVGVVLAAGGYPGAYEQEALITGLPQTDAAGEKVFHGGTSLSAGQCFTQGGRVLCVAALGDNVAKAQARAHDMAARIGWQDMFYRRDIGWRAIEREQSALCQLGELTEA